MWHRLTRTPLEARLRAAPAVAIVGPRQCGKTTLASTFDGARFDLEIESERLRLDLAWPELETGQRLVILDEAQTWPEVFPRVRAAIDRDRKRRGRFLILGSVAPALMTQVSESLAGRLSVVELTPLLLAETPDRDLDAHWLYGGFADGGLLEASDFPRWQNDYLELVTQRDLPSAGFPARPAVTRRFLQMLAALQGQAWNASRLGQNLGLTHPTVSSYLDYLEGAFLVRRVPPFTPNIVKRLVKTPRVHVRDSGLTHALLNITSRDALLAHPVVGASWECFVVEQILGHLAARGERVEPHYFRTSDGHEVDLVLPRAGKTWAIEIKLTTDPTHGDLSRLERAADLAGAEQRVLVCRTPDPVITPDRWVTHLADLVTRM